MNVDKPRLPEPFNEKQVAALKEFFKAIGILPPKEMDTDSCLSVFPQLIGLRYVKTPEAVQKAFLELSQTGFFDVKFLNQLAGSILYVEQKRIKKQNPSAN